MMRANRSIPGWLVAGLLLLAAFLTASSVPGPFTLDETNYIQTVRALRQGGLVLRETEGLSFSESLLFFDPTPRRFLPQTPICSTIPPLWAFLAWPFSFLGWYGLVALNALSFCLALGLVWQTAIRWTGSTRAGWLAMSCLGLGSYQLEYAQGIWPHGLSLALLLGAFLLADPGGGEEDSGHGFLGGLLAGLAIGLRYANVLYAGGIFASLLFSRSPPKRLAAFGVGLLPALLACSWINHSRLGSWNPVSKGPGYQRMRPARPSGRHFEAGRVLWARLADYRFRPYKENGEAFYQPTPEIGAYPIGDRVVGFALKKAWLQSSPWLALGLIGVLLAWFRCAGPGSSPARLRALGVAAWSVFGVFALLGFGRHDGLGFNQRYLIDALPWMALAVALLMAEVLESQEEPGIPLVRGFSLGMIAAGWPFFLLGEMSWVRHAWISWIPLGLALLLLGLFQLRKNRGWALLLVLGICLGWSLAVHLFDDLRVSRNLRASHQGVADKLAQVLPGRAAVFLSPAQASTVARLLLEPERDLIGVSPAVDQAASAPVLIRELLDSGRRVFVIENNMGPKLFARIHQGWGLRPVQLPADPPSELRLHEILPSEGEN